MRGAAEEPRQTYAEYLAQELAREEKWEYFDGRAWAMSGGTPEHAGLSAAMLFRLAELLAGRPCRVFSSDLRVRVAATGLATYPDATVVCGKLELHPEDPHAVTNPTILVEVLSPSSAAWDRGEKFAHYRRIPSLAEYVLVSQSEPHVEVYRRNEHGRFELFEYRPGDHIELASLDVTINLDALYRDPLAS